MTKTVINKIQERVNREFNQLTAAANTIDQVAYSLDGEVKDFDAAMRGLDELRGIFSDILGGLRATTGNLREGQELLNDLVDGSANSVTLINQLVDVFMAGDYGILVQALEVLDPPLRVEALRKLPRDARQQLLKELNQVDYELG